MSSERVINMNGHIPILDDPFSTSSSAKCALGQPLEYGDGRKYVYAKAGGSDLAVAKVQQAPARIADHVTNLTITDVTAGSKKVTITNGATTALTANMYKDGFFIIEDNTGEGYLHTIKSHPAAATGATCELTLWEAIQVTTSSATGGLFKHPLGATIVAPTTATGPVVGVTPCAVTASYYYWMLVRGYGAVTINGTPATGVGVVRGGTTPGTVDTATSSTTGKILGQEVELGVSTEQRIVDFNIR